MKEVVSGWILDLNNTMSKEIVFWGLQVRVSVGKGTWGRCAHWQRLP